MRLGIWTPLPHTIMAEPAMTDGVRQVGVRGDRSADKSFQFALDVVSRGEALGFDITLIAERLLGPDLEAWMLTAALAARTKTITVMPAVYPGMITPQLAAKMGATLDRITGGRFAINVVNGWFQKEFELFSNGGWIASSDVRYDRMDEFVRVLKGLWAEDDFTFNGEFFRADNATLPQKPVRLPHPPIYTASRAEFRQGRHRRTLRSVVRQLSAGLSPLRRKLHAHPQGHFRSGATRQGIRPDTVIRHERAYQLCRYDGGSTGAGRRA